ncbi:hypothetical protein RRG08_033883 [Elysia crispata]|uniref:Secreted protein n=1 Tax=Elysia crispata TaxID=231223 RepID=A0AAE1B8V1_9GAST|nr:hypothetical protein RRG08_033883 [Elysia crispata]
MILFSVLFMNSMISVISRMQSQASSNTYHETQQSLTGEAQSSPLVSACKRHPSTRGFSLSTKSGKKDNKVLNE